MIWSKKNSLDALQKKINYQFQDISLLRNALTHTSFANEQQAKNIHDNERLEFLGDAVLGMVITHILMEKFTELPEGKLSKLRAAIISKDGIASIAQKYSLGSYVRLGRGEEASGGRTKSSILANVYEALIAAVYYDAGYQEVFELIANHFAHIIAGLQENGFFKDYKSRLQQYTQSVQGTVPEYHIISEEGPDHEKMFEVRVIISGTVYATGQGRNKKTAEQEAAQKTLRQLFGEEIE